MKDPRRRKGFDDDFFRDDLPFNHDFQRRMHERIHKIMDEITRGFPQDMNPGKSYVYGFNMTVGPDGKPIVEEFGNSPSYPAGRPSDDREPLVEVIKKDDETTVVAELPGVEKGDINLEADEEGLTISVDTPDRKYHKELDLEGELDPQSIKASYKNGILEVKIRTKQEKKKDRKRIDIE